MIKPEQIPKEVRAAIDKYRIRTLGKPISWEEAMVECVAEAINAWPGAERVRLGSFEPVEELILPLPQEKNDD